MARSSPSRRESFDALNIEPFESDLQDLDDLLNSPRPNSPLHDTVAAAAATTTTAVAGLHQNDLLGISPSTSIEVNESHKNINSCNSSSNSTIKRTSPTSHFLARNVNLSNAVHMEVQENAKVPNLYHVPIRRSVGYGNSQQAQMNQQQQQQQQQMANSNAANETSGLVDEILRLTEADLTLTENFLGDGQRYAIYVSILFADLLTSLIIFQLNNECLT